MFEAAQLGNLEELRHILVEDPLILHNVSLFSSHNPLHVASIFGRSNFAKEIVRLRPELTKELNQDGFSPLHLASANGYIDIVRELLKIDNSLCRLEGRERRTPLHSAAIKGRGDVISELIRACGDCIEDVTVQGETALHLAVKNCQFESIKVLVEWMREMNKRFVLNMKDEKGNTVLHLATWRKQRQVVELLCSDGATSSGTMEVNAVNQGGLTALDTLAIFPSEAGDREIEEILRNAGANRTRENFLSPALSIQGRSVINNSTTNYLVDYFKFHKERDSPSEVRSALLVIAVLVATATYQVGLSPPGGVWQDDTGPTQNNNNRTNYAGKSILGTENLVSFGVFAIFNSIGFFVSLFMINTLISKFPLQLELQICMLAMYITYSTAVVFVAPKEISVALTVLTSVLPLILRIIATLVRRH